MTSLFGLRAFHGNSLLVYCRLPFPRTLFLVLDVDRHLHIGKLLLQRDDVLIAQTDTAFAGTAWDAALIVGAAVDAYS